jgi:hypothetical protein
MYIFQGFLFLLKFSVEVTAVEGCWAAITTHVPPFHLDHKRKSKNPPDTGKFKKKERWRRCE